MLHCNSYSFMFVIDVSYFEFVSARYVYVFILRVTSHYTFYHFIFANYVLHSEFISAGYVHVFILKFVSRFYFTIYFMF